MATFTMTQPTMPQQQGIASPGGFPQPTPRPAPPPGSPSGPTRSAEDVYGARNVTQVPQPPTREQSPFMQQFQQQLKVLDPEQREAFIGTAMQGIQDRLARYNYRISRGRQLSADQQVEYDSLLASLGDIQDYMYNLEAIPSKGSFDFQHPSFSSKAGSNFVQQGTPTTAYAPQGIPSNLVPQVGRPGEFFNLDANQLTRR